MSEWTLDPIHPVETGGTATTLPYYSKLLQGVIINSMINTDDKICQVEQGKTTTEVCEGILEWYRSSFLVRIPGSVVPVGILSVGFTTKRQPNHQHAPNKNNEMVLV